MKEKVRETCCYDFDYIFSLNDFKLVEYYQNSLGLNNPQLQLNSTQNLSF